MSITLTQKAADHINKHLQKHGQAIGLRLGVKTTGCSGLAYNVEYVEQSQDSDQIFEQLGIKIFIDPKSMPFVDGTQVDYAREGLNEGFRFTNPNEKASCGCGESFTV